MAVANERAVKYAELTDEHIVDVKKGIELFVKSNEYWDRFVHHSSVPRGHKEYTSRRLIAPKVKKEDIRKRAELVAPRPSKIAVMTVTKTVDNYGDKALYTREDLQYHFDNTVGNIRATLQEIAVQKLDLIKGEPFFKSKAIITPVNDGSGNPKILLTAEKAAIILRKNKANRWDGQHFLAHITPEELNLLRAEIAAKGDRLSEPVKKELDGRTYDVYTYGDFMYSVTVSDLMYKNASTQYIVFMGKRGIDGQSPVDVAKLQGESGIEVINNGLGSGVLVDEDGNYTADDNKQQGSVAINMDGLGACVSDDLCILDCEFAAEEIKGIELPLSQLSGYLSHSGAEIEVGLTAGSNTALTVEGARFDSTASKYYGSAGTILAVKVAGNSGYTLGTVNASKWSATYKNANGGDNIDAEILGFGDSFKTMLVRVPANAYSFAVACTATASA